MVWLIRVVMVLVALGGIVYIAGAAQPQDHVASVRARIPASRDAVYQRIVDVTGAPSWRSDLESVEVLSESPLRWRESGKYGAIDYEREIDEPDLVVARIVGERTDFGGLWRYRLEPAGDGTLVTIVEEGEVYSPVFRFFSRFVFGHHRTMESWLRDLGTSFGATVATERVE